MAKKRLSEIPGDLFSWCDAFNDDLGFEATTLPAATAYPAGSHEKIATIVERINRGQALWNPEDAGMELAVDSELGEVFAKRMELVPDSYRIAGSENLAAAVGVDREGRKHRYALWWRQPVLSLKPKSLLYVTEHCGYADSYKHDAELSAIFNHAKSQGAGFVAVVSLLTARVANEFEMRSVSFPVTGISFLWARWLAKQCDQVVACWGKKNPLSRAVDMLWMLSRTAKGGRVYAVVVDADYPEKIRSGDKDMYRFSYDKIISERVREDEELERLAARDVSMGVGDADTGDRSGD